MNVDGALGARLAKIPAVSRLARALGLIKGRWSADITVHNLRRPLFFPDSQFEFVYLSHVLEHFRWQEGASLLKECFRVLRPGGVLRVVVPDLVHHVDRYNQGALKAQDFLSELSTCAPEQPNALKAILGPLFFFPHLCMYDSESLLRAVENQGFSNVRQCEQFESSFVHLREVEGSNAGVGTLIVEGVRP